MTHTPGPPNHFRQKLLDLVRKSFCTAGACACIGACHQRKADAILELFQATHPTPDSVQRNANNCAHGAFAWLWGKGRDWQSCLSAALNAFLKELAEPGCEANSVVRNYPTPDREGLIKEMEALKLGIYYVDGRPHLSGRAEPVNTTVDKCIAIVRQHQIDIGGASTRKDEVRDENGVDSDVTPPQSSEIPVADKPDTLIMACQEVLRLMEKWANHYAYSDVCQRAVDKLRLEMQSYLRTTEPVSVDHQTPKSEPNLKGSNVHD